MFRSTYMNIYFSCLGAYYKETEGNPMPMQRMLKIKSVTHLCLVGPCSEAVMLHSPVPPGPHWATLARLLLRHHMLDMRHSVAACCASNKVSIRIPERVVKISWSAFLNNHKTPSSFILSMEEKAVDTLALCNHLRILILNLHSFRCNFGGHLSVLFSLSMFSKT